MTDITVNDFKEVIGCSWHKLSETAFFFGQKIDKPENIDGRGHVCLYDSGIEIIGDESDHVVCVVLTVRADEWYSPYAPMLPAGLKMEMTRNEVRARLGSPVKSGEPQTLPALGPFPAWDRFVIDNLGVHVLYTFENDGIKRLSFDNPDFLDFLDKA